MPSSVRKNHRVAVAVVVVVPVVRVRRPFSPFFPSFLPPFPATLLMLDLREQKAQRQKGGRNDGRKDGGRTTDGQKGLGVRPVHRERRERGRERERETERERILKFSLILHFFLTLLVFPKKKKRARAFFQQVKLQPDSSLSWYPTKKGEKRKGPQGRRGASEGRIRREGGTGWSERVRGSGL